MGCPWCQNSTWSHHLLKHLSKINYSQKEQTISRTALPDRNLESADTCRHLWWSEGNEAMTSGANSVSSSSHNHSIRKKKADLICNKLIICHKDGCQPQLDGWADSESLSGTWLQNSHSIWSPLPWSITAVVSRNAHLVSEELKGMRRRTKIPSWRDGNGYLTKLHIRTSNFLKRGAFQRCLGNMKPFMGSTQTKYFWLGGFLMVYWGF